MNPQRLLTRDQFRTSVIQRDGHKCLNCGVKDKPLDAHHIMERRLWPDGGYYLDNGATLCDPTCHMLAEKTLLTCEEIREKAGIKAVLLPPHLYPDETYDKWGNVILPNGQRLQGELFHDLSVQRVLQGSLGLFNNRVRYPRTYHFPWSPGATKDDRILPTLEGFEGQEVVVTVKMDGENTTIYKDGLHARSLTYDPHPSRNRVRALAARLSGDLTEDVRICGENLFAKHSIHYQNLPDHFLLFSVWKKNLCLSWDETMEWAELLELQVVPVLYRGTWNEKLIREIHQTTFDGNPCEGYVVRVAREFSYGEFRKVVGKYVRESHVQTHGGWMRNGVIPNGINTNNKR